MTLKSIGLLSMAITCVATISFSISSCDSNSSGPTTPGNGGVDRNKHPQALDDGGAIAIGGATTGQGGATVAYNDFSLDAQGLNGADGNGLTATFDAPINSYSAAVNATIDAAGGSLYYEARDADGNVEARVDIQAQARASGGYDVFPTFTSHADQGEGNPQYEVTVFNGNNPVGTPKTLDASQKVTLLPNNGIPPVITSLGWRSAVTNAQCIFKLGLDPCGTYVFQYPDGSTFTGTAIQFKEKNTNGVYVYVYTQKIGTGGNVPTYSVKSSTAYVAN